MKILIALSGGVDSALSAFLLKEQGHEVHGVMMSTWDESMPIPPVLGGCVGPKQKDIAEAQAVADKVGIPFSVIDLAKEFRDIVLDNFKKEYALGRTPNPCILCNPYLKFGLLVSKVFESGFAFDKFATGHYCRICYDDNCERYQLKTAKDKKKDQSYFLYRLSQEQLSKIIFPLSELSKVEVRQLADKYALPVASKKDSQDFYGGNYNDLLKFPFKEGNIVDKSGNILGHHQGIWNFTIGKRKGLLGGGTKEPIYVTSLDAKNNNVVVGPKEDLFSKEIIVSDINWVSIAPQKEFHAQVKIRAQHTPAHAKVKLLDDGKLRVIFDEEQMSVTAGQSAVFYNEDVLLCGGII